jgi:hypothetical protein
MRIARRRGFICTEVYQQPRPKFLYDSRRIVSCYISLRSRLITNRAISYVHGIMDSEAVTSTLKGQDIYNIFKLR